MAGIKEADLHSAIPSEGIVPVSNSDLKEEISCLTPATYLTISEKNVPPIHRIPWETTSHIFKHCLRKNYPSPPHAKPKLSPPLLLGAVCKRWRDISWAIPHLWTRIYINIYSNNMQFQMELLEGFLARSGHLPLAIQFNGDFDKSTPEADDLIFPFVDLINQHSNRWLRLSVSIPGSLLSVFAGDPKGSSILQHLSIYLHGPGPVQAMSFGMTSPIHHPSRLNIASTQLPSLNIHWNNITHFEGFSLPIDQCWELLIRAPLLTDCKFYGMTYNSRSLIPQGNDAQILHRTLQTLDIDENTSSAVAYFLHYITTPSLRELSCDTTFRASYPTRSLASLFIRSACPLRRLVLDEGEIDELELIELLRSVPTLQELILFPHKGSTGSSVTVSDDFLRLFSTPNMLGHDVSSPLFLPNLQSLSYSGAKTFSWCCLRAAFGLNSCRPQKMSSLKISLLNYKHDTDIMDKDAMLSFLSLLEAGSTVVIQGLLNDSCRMYDLLRLSAVHHGLA